MPDAAKPEIDGFPRGTLVGVLCAAGLDGSPNGVPVPIERAGSAIQVFGFADNKKVARLDNYPKAGFLVAHPAGSPSLGQHPIQLPFVLAGLSVFP